MEKKLNTPFRCTRYPDGMIVTEELPVDEHGNVIVTPHVRWQPGPNPLGDEWTPELEARIQRLAQASKEGRFDEQFAIEFPNVETET